MHFRREDKSIRDQINLFSAYKSPCSKSHTNKSIFTQIYLFAKRTDYILSNVHRKVMSPKVKPFIYKSLKGRFCIFKKKSGTFDLCDIQVN